MRTRVKELREKRKMSQTSLAMKVGTTQQTISKIENEIMTPHGDVLMNLARFFHVTVDYLVYMSDKPVHAEYEITANRVLSKQYRFLENYSRLSSCDRRMVEELVERLLGESTDQDM